MANAGDRLTAEERAFDQTLAEATAALSVLGTGKLRDQPLVSEGPRSFPDVAERAWTEEDQPLPEDDSIQAAHPTRTGDHGTYAEAMRLVGAKRSKYALVDLVNWLLRRERAAREEEREKAVAGRLEWRGIETPCSVCGGAGVRAYGNTSTWRGGMGGSSITADVCDHCWSSGDEHRHFADQRRLERLARDGKPDAERAAFEAGWRAIAGRLAEVDLVDALKRFTEAGKRP